MSMRRSVRSPKLCSKIVFISSGPPSDTFIDSESGLAQGYTARRNRSICDDVKEEEVKKGERDNDLRTTNTHVPVFTIISNVQVIGRQQQQQQVIRN